MPLAAIAFLCASPVVIDGDTLRCAEQGRVRLVSIDAPEMGGRCRQGRVCTPGDPDASKAYLARLVARGPVRCVMTARDRYGRILARCSAGGQDLSCAMVRSGHAVERYGRLTCK